MWPNKIGDEKLVVLGALKTTKEKATQGWLCYYWWVGRDWLRRNCVFELATNGLKRCFNADRLNLTRKFTLTSQ